MTAEHLSPEVIGAVVDGELSPAEERTAQEHLNDCHACALKVIAAGQLKSGTARAGHNFTPSTDALARLTAVARQNPLKPAKVIRIRPVAWTAAAALLLIALFLGGSRVLRRSDALSAEILDQHLATLSDAAAPQVLSTDRHTVKPWFQGKLPFSFNIPEANAFPPDTNLVGGDLAYVSGRPTALLLFTVHKHHVSVFLSQAGTVPDFVRLNDRAGFHLAKTKSAGLEIVGISDVNPAELNALVASISAAQ